MTTWQGWNEARVAERYEIAEAPRCVVKISEKTTSYNPWDYPEVVNELANVKWNDDVSALKFVQKRGFLGNWFDIGILSEDREPISHLQRHGQGVQFLLKLISLIHAKDPIAVDKHLDEVAPEDWSYPWNDYHFSLDLAAAQGYSGLEAGAHVLTAILNTVMSGVHPLYLPSEDGTIWRVTTARSLLTVIYCHIASTVEGKLGYYQCANRHCHKWWPANTETRGPKRKYCPPDVGTRESLCSRQERYYRTKR